MLALAPRSRLRIQQYGASVLLLPACAYFALVEFGTGGALGLPWLLVHAFNLVVHEAGHAIFGVLGTFMMFLGGSLMQLVLPGVCAWSALVARNALGLQLSLLWLGQNFVDIAVYAADAQTRALPLLGGLGAEHHDWYNVLSMAGLLDHAALVAGALRACAFGCWLVMVLVPRWLD